MRLDWTPPELGTIEQYPFPPERTRKVKKRREHKPSPWVAFLTSLQHGQNFLVECYRLSSVKNHARKLGINIVHRDTNVSTSSGMRCARVWRKDL